MLSMCTLGSDGEPLRSPRYEMLRLPIESFFQLGDLAFSANLSQNEYLFVPSHLIARITSEERGSVIVSSCFVDASNINSFKDALSAFAEAEVDEEESSKSLEEFRKLQLSHQLSMVKSPSDVTIGEYFQSRGRGRGSAADDVTVVRREEKSRDRRGLHKKDFKKWQTDNKWNLFVQVMSLPRPVVVAGILVGRTNASLSFRSDFHPPVADKTKFGFNIALCPPGHQAIRYTMVPPAPYDVVGSCHMLKVTRRGGVSAAWTSPPSSSTSSAVIRPSEEVLGVFQLSLQGLSPLSFYQVGLGAFYDQSEGPWSLYTLPFLTLPLTPPSPPGDRLVAVMGEDEHYLFASIIFSAPIDDGGSALLGYRLSSRNCVTGVWLSRGDFPPSGGGGGGTIRIDHLLPGVEYEFRLSSFNAQGESGLVTSNRVVYADSFVSTRLIGRGHPHFRSGGEGAALLPMVEIDLGRQEMKIADKVLVDINMYL